MNDFCRLFDELLANYVDDSNLSVIRDEVQEVKGVLENEIVKALKRFEENHMKENSDKFQCILHSKTPDPEFGISLGNTVIEPSDTVDLLGIIIHDKLTFHHHVKKMTNNAALKLNALQRQSKWLDPEVRLDYGRTLVNSSFQYCPLAWYVCSWIETCWL